MEKKRNNGQINKNASYREKENGERSGKKNEKMI